MGYSWPQRLLSRVTSSGRFVPEIDGLRFVAIMAVLFYHIGGYIELRHGERTGEKPPITSRLDRLVDTVAGAGNFGVQLFFGISGFILALPFAEADLSGQPRPSLKRYFLRRVTRLEPPYIINLLIWYVAQVVIKGGTFLGLLPHLMASIFYVHNLVYGKFSAINGVAWTLEIEVQFYLLAPLLTLIFRIQRAWIRRGIMLTIMTVMPLVDLLIFENRYPRWWMSIGGEIQYFLVGFLLADVYLTNWHRQPMTQPIWNWIGLLAWTSLLAMITLAPSARGYAWGPIFVAYCAAFRAPVWRRFFSWSPVVIIGGMCYTIYLYHWMIYYIAGKFTMHIYSLDRPFWVNFVIQSALLIPVAIAVSAVLFVLFEKPFMRRDWVDRVLAALRRKPAAANSTESVRPK